MNVAIFSGELSGDLIGAALARALKALEPGVTLWGLGSEAMRAEGVELLADSAAWGAIGVTQALAKVPGLLARIVPKVKKALRHRRPDVVVLIDFGAFNTRAARWSKELGLKVLYYFPPGAWRRSGGKGANLAQLTDLLAVPFPWAVERYEGFGANAVYVGHPLVERARAQMTREEFAAQFDMDSSRPIIGLLPGSRLHEVEHLMPTLIEAAKRIGRQVPDAQFVIGVAGSLSQEMIAQYLQQHGELRDRISELWHEFAQEAGSKVLKPVARTASALASKKQNALVTPGGVVVPLETWQEELEARKRSARLHKRAEDALPPIVLAKGLTYEVMAHSDLLLTCSGTATLEATLFQTPMIVLYRGSKWMELEYRLRGIRKKIPFIGLPNILAERGIVPELIQEDATPEAIAQAALPMLNDIATRQRIKQDLKQVAALLGTPGASAKTAKLVIELAQT